MRPSGEQLRMPFDHEKLDVYHPALDALELCDQIGGDLPPGRANVRDQLDRASTSVVANIAEGAGEFSRPEKARFYRIARRSAIEVVAWLDIARRRKEVDGAILEATMVEYEAVGAMRVRLIKAIRPVGQGHPPSAGHGHPPSVGHGAGR